MNIDELSAALGELDRKPVVALTIDVEWAHPVVLADVVHLLAERDLPATFFVTHAAVEIPAGERALHPNFFREGNSLWEDSAVQQAAQDGEGAYWRKVVAATSEFCPEAVGVRSHGLFSASKLLAVYREAGLRYDSSAFLPGAAHLRPTRMAAGLLELPFNYMDYAALNQSSPDLGLDSLALGEPGLRILDFHPNLIFGNCRSIEEYEATKSDYHDPDRLLTVRKRPGRGVRDVFVEVLDHLAAGGHGLPLLREIDVAWRSRTTGP